MKFLFLLLFILSNALYAQSPKKQFTVLNAKFNELKKHQDSLITVQLNTKTEYNDLKERLKNDLDDVNDDILESIELDKNISECFDKANELEVYFDLNAIDEVDLNQLRLNYALLDSFFLENTLSVSKLKSTNDSIALHSMNYKQKNEQLKQNNTIMEENILMLKRDIEMNRLLLLKAERIFSDANNLKRKAESSNSDKRSQLAFIERGIKEERDKFEKNGPEGFSLAYFAVFPEVFPDYKPAKKKGKK